MISTGVLRMALPVSGTESMSHHPMSSNIMMPMF
jgi:hypothetical protein